MNFESEKNNMNIEINKRFNNINKTISINIVNVLKNIEEIENVVVNEWKGIEAEKFINNLDKAKDQVIEQLNSLRKVFENEFNLTSLKGSSMNDDLVDSE